MGYFTLDFKKAKGASDARMSDHIERRVIASNVDPTRTHLNRELVQLPEGVTERDEAIAHRIKSAGIKRKITPDQVRAIRVMLSGTHEDMMNIQQDGRIGEWCDDSIQWLHKTFGKENTVSAVLHMDETTPHIHATIVPIVTGERRKTKKKQAEGKRTYRKKTDAARLCADDVLNRDRLIAYHDAYAKVMAKYGLQRGVRGSEARHTTTAQYYREIKKMSDALDAETKRLQEQKAEAEQELKHVKSEIRTDKLKSVATDAATVLASSVSSLFGSGKIKSLERKNEDLQDEISIRDETIEQLQSNMKRMQEEYRQAMMNQKNEYRKSLEAKDAEHKEETNRLNSIISKAHHWFPHFADFLRLDRIGRRIGLSAIEFAEIIKGKVLNFTGKLFSAEHNHWFATENTPIQIMRDTDKRLTIAINRISLGQWFSEQYDKLRQTVRQPVQPRKSRGMKL